MKLIISESQLRAITLNEAEFAKERIIYTDDNIEVFTFDGVKMSQDFYASIRVVNRTKQYMTLLIEKGDNWGYRGEGEIEYDKAPIKPGTTSEIKFDVSVGRIKNPGYNRTVFNLTYMLRGVRKAIKVDYSWRTYTEYDKQQLQNQIISKCKKSRGYDKLKPAVDWWRKWLNNDTTKAKFAKLFNYDANTVAEKFSDYNKILDGIKIKYVYDASVPNSAWAEVNGKGFGAPMTMNCAVEDKNVVSVMIHEIQHLLNDYHKFHPFSDNIWTYYRDLLSPPSSDVKDIKTKLKQQNLIDYLVKTGFDLTAANSIVSRYKWRIENDELHLKNPNETTSELYQVREALKLKPGQDITKEMLIRNWDNTEVLVLIHIWLYSRQTLDSFLSYYNSIAKSDRGSNNNMNTFG